jgi:hypothetical protein
MIIHLDSSAIRRFIAAIALFLPHIASEADFVPAPNQRCNAFTSGILFAAKARTPSLLKYYL